MGRRCFRGWHHIQLSEIRDIQCRAKSCGKLTVLGGSAVSSSPETYPEFDYLHIGEIGDATDELIATLDRGVEPPPAQRRFETRDRLPLSSFPLPRYDAVPLARYLIGSLQFSSGCPYRCEFCDIPALYGRQPRLKSPAQLLAELDAFVSQPAHPPVIYLVDDNFIGNRKAARDLLPHLIDWQKRRGYPLQFACEATLNIAKQTDILALMREAGFLTVFVGIETPEPEVLTGIDKAHNASLPMLEAIDTLNRHGLEVTSGIIMGLDLETDESEAKLIEFIDRSQIPIFTINVLQALPKTPLWERLAREDRLVAEPDQESNVEIPSPAWRSAGQLASRDRICLHARATVRPFSLSDRRDLCSPLAIAGKGQAHQDQPPARRRARLEYRLADWDRVGLPRGILERGVARFTPRPDRGDFWHGLRRVASDPVHARGIGRPAKRLLLRGKQSSSET